MHNMKEGTGGVVLLRTFLFLKFFISFGTVFLEVGSEREKEVLHIYIPYNSFLVISCPKREALAAVS